MRMTVECISEDAGSYVGKSGPINYTELTLLDHDPVREARMKSTFTYRLTEDEKTKFAGKLVDKEMTMDAKDWEFFNSKLKIRTGKIVEVKGLPAK